MFYIRKKPTLDQVKNFFAKRGRKDAYVRVLGVTAMIDATPGALKNLQKTETEVVQTSLKLGVDPGVKFSKAEAKILSNATADELKIVNRLNVKFTEKNIDNKLQELQEELDPKYFDELYNNYFKPFIELKKEAEKNKWPDAEEVVLSNILSLAKSIPGLTTKQKKLNKDSQKVDIEFNLNGKDVFLEIKTNVGARLGQIYIHTNTKGKKYINKINNKFTSKIIDADKKSSKILTEWITKNYPEEIFIEKNKRGEDIFVVTADAYAAA